MSDIVATTTSGVPRAEPPDPRLRGDRRLAITVVALLAACALIVVLGWQNRALRQEQRDLVERAERPYVGMVVPEIAARGVDGRPVTLGATRRGAQILYFFLPSCPYCKASIPAVAALSERATGPELIGIGAGSPDELRDYARASGFTFPVVELADRTRSLYRARDVPMVLVVDGDGQVRYRRVGALALPHVDEILAAAAIPAQLRDWSFQPGVLQ